MHNFKKILISTSLFLTGCILMSVVLLGFYFNTCYQYYQDAGVREELAGTIDTLFVGSSRSFYGIDTEAIDKCLGGNSYSLSAPAISPTGKYTLVKKELQRNNIKKVVLGLEDDDLTYDNERWKSEGEISLISRLSNPKERVNYFFKNVRVEDYPKFYSVWMNLGTKAVIKSVLSPESNGTEIKTIHKKKPKDISLTDDEILNERASEPVEPEVEQCKDQLRELIKLCQSYNAEVVLIIMPNAESWLWRAANYEPLVNDFVEIANETNCKIYNFDLFINRDEYFNDSSSFYDKRHLSSEGADSFTKLYCEFFTEVNNGTDVSNMFYSSYDEAIKHMDYYKKYQELIKEQ